MRAHAVVAALVLGSVTVVPAAAADPAVSRVVERTFSCEAGYVGGLHRIDLSSAYSTTPGSTSLRVTSAVTQDMHSAALGQLTSDGFTVHRGLCSPARGPSS